MYAEFYVGDQYKTRTAGPLHLLHIWEILICHLSPELVEFSGDWLLGGNGGLGCLSLIWLSLLYYILEESFTFALAALKKSKGANYQSGVKSRFPLNTLSYHLPLFGTHPKPHYSLLVIAKMCDANSPHCAIQFANTKKPLAAPELNHHHLPMRKRSLPSVHDPATVPGNFGHPRIWKLAVAEKSIGIMACHLLWRFGGFRLQSFCPPPVHPSCMEPQGSEM
jgi:hypothetical protein